MLIDESKKRDIVFSEDKHYFVSSVVCDYGIWERDSKHGDKEIDGNMYSLKLILNSRSNALRILEILDADTKHQVYESPFKPSQAVSSCEREMLPF